MEVENRDSQHILGSAEPLTPDETRKRLQELEAWGVDLSLVRASLQRTPAERVTRMFGLLKIAREMNRAYITQISQAQRHGTR